MDVYRPAYLLSTGDGVITMCYHCTQSAGHTRISPGGCHALLFCARWTSRRSHLMLESGSGRSRLYAKLQKRKPDLAAGAGWA
jgi:hypothetical protein